MDRRGDLVNLLQSLPRELNRMSNPQIGPGKAVFNNEQEDWARALAFLDEERRASGAPRVVMLSIVSGGDVRVFKEAQSLAGAGFQVVVVGRRLDAVPLFETIDGVHYFRVDALDRPNDVLKAATAAEVHCGMPLVRRMQVAGLGAAGWAAQYSFAQARIAPRSNRMMAVGSGLLHRYAIRPLHVLSGYALHQLEYARTVIELAPDVIHAHDLYMLRSAAVAAAKTRSRLVYDAHELEADRIAETRALLKSNVRAEEQRFAKQADAVITVSPRIADEMQRTLGIAPPVLICNAPPLDPMPGGRTLRKDLHLADDVPLVLFVGKALAYHRGDHRMDLLIEAVSLLPKAHLAVLGPTNDASREALHNAAASFGMAERFHILEPVPYQTVVAYIADADAGTIVMPPRTRNIDWALPNKFFEYALAGLPIVTFGNSQLIEIAPDFTTIEVVDEVTGSALSEGIARALDPDRRPDCDAIAHMRNAYGWPAQAARLVGLYEELTGWSSLKGTQSL